MNDTKEYENLQKSLEKDYLLIRKGRWWSFLGGVIGFLIVAGIVSYKAALSAVESGSAQTATNLIIGLKSKAEIDSEFIANLRNNYSSDLEYLKTLLSR